MTGDPVPHEDADDHLLAQIREAYGRVVYSHKTQEKQADICFTMHRWQQWVLIGLTAISSGTFLVSLLGVVTSQETASLVTAFVALLVTGTTLATKNFKFAEESDGHRDTAARLWNVRESYLSLITDLMAGEVSSTDARIKRDELQDELGAIYAEAPRTGSWAFKKAGGGLKENEEMTFTAEELDLLVPQALRLGQSGE